MLEVVSFILSFLTIILVIVLAIILYYKVQNIKLYIDEQMQNLVTNINHSNYYEYSIDNDLNSKIKNLDSNIQNLYNMIKNK